MNLRPDLTRVVAGVAIVVIVLGPPVIALSMLIFGK